MNHWGTRSHAWLYRRSGGRALGRIGRLPVLVLETTGRRSGRTHPTPVQYTAHGEDLIVVAADHGARHHPAWCLNLRAQARARVRIGERSFDVTAREARGNERTQLWRELVAANHYLPGLQAKAGRQLPLILLTPRTLSEGDDLT